MREFYDEEFGQIKTEQQINNEYNALVEARAAKQAENPHIGYPRIPPLSEFKRNLIKETPEPEVTDLQVAVVVGAEKLDGEWQYTYEIQDKSSADKTLALAEAITAKKVSIEKEREMLISQGLPYTFPGDVQDVIQIRDDRDRNNIDGFALGGAVLVMAQDTTSTVPFWGESNTEHQLTGAEAVALGQAVKVWIEGHMRTARGHKNAVDKFTDPEDVASVKAYDFSGGWPE